MPWNLAFFHPFLRVPRASVVNLRRPLPYFSEKVFPLQRLRQHGGGAGLAGRSQSSIRGKCAIAISGAGASAAAARCNSTISSPRHWPQSNTAAITSAAASLGDRNRVVSHPQLRQAVAKVSAIARSRLKTAIKPRRSARPIGVGQQPLFVRRRRRQRPSATFPGGQAPHFPLGPGWPLMPIRADDAGPRRARPRLALAPTSQQGDDPGQGGNLSQPFDLTLRELARPSLGNDNHIDRRGGVSQDRRGFIDVAGPPHAAQRRQPVASLAKLASIGVAEEQEGKPNGLFAAGDRAGVVGRILVASHSLDFLRAVMIVNAPAPSIIALRVGSMAAKPFAVILAKTQEMAM